MRVIAMAFLQLLAARSATAFKAPIQGALGRTLNRSAVRTMASLDSEDSKALYTLGQVSVTWRVLGLVARARRTSEQPARGGARIVATGRKCTRHGNHRSNTPLASP